MAGNLSDYAEGKILEHSVGKTAWSLPTVYVALYTTTPGDATSAANTGEVSTSSTGYARQAVPGSSWGSASGGQIQNSAVISFPQATGSWGQVNGVALVDGASGGSNIIWYGALTTPKTVTNGDTFQFQANALTLTLD